MYFCLWCKSISHDYFGFAQFLANLMLMKKVFYLALILASSFLKKDALANFINVQNTTLTGQNTTTGTIQVQFDLSWNNSWRDSINYDGAWVFVKYRIGSGNWIHANLASTGFVNGTGTNHVIQIAPLTATNIRPGAMIYRGVGGVGNFGVTGMQLAWAYGTQTVSNADALTAQLRVFATEMVFIPQGNFFVGDGVNTRFHLYNGGTAPIQITGTAYSSQFFFNSINMTHRAHGQNGLDINGNSLVDAYPTDNPDYPTGWKAFWMMKYEISQGQYTDFLNTLTYDQQTSRFPGGNVNTVNFNIQSGSTTDNNRYTIRVGTTGTSPSTPRVLITVRPDRANNFMDWTDLAAFSDWSGLRMLTELEYEKAGRGFLNAVANEFAWGTATGVAGTTLSGTENGTETITEAGANYSLISTARSGGDGNTGPLRVGIHATSTTTRTQSGASYFGVMDLTGNVGEMYVNVQHNNGRTYRGYDAQWHGDGTLLTDGFANVANWTGNAATTTNVATTAVTVNQNTGFVYRGHNQSVTNGSDDYRLNDRFSVGNTVGATATSFNNSGRVFWTGGRVGRSGW